MGRKIVYLMSVTLTFVLLDIFLNHSSIRAVQPQYLKTCTYDSNGKYLWHTCGYDETENCSKDNC